MSTKITILLSLIFLINIACNKDDDDSPLPTVNHDQPLTFADYDPDRHLFGNAFFQEENNQEWETIIDLITGDYDTIPNTYIRGGTIFFPLGTRTLTDFEGKRRIFRTLNGGNLVIQNLENLDKEIISISETSDGEYISSLPNYLKFGATNNIIYGWSNDESIYRIDLSTGTIDYIVKRLNLPNYQNEYFLYLEESHQLVMIGKNNELDKKVLYIFDLNTETISLEKDITESFGFVAHPNGEQFYGLTTPQDDIGIRLMDFRILDNQLTERMVSSEDLSIINLGDNLQTIHTATNSYICKRHADNGSPSTILSSIDLNTGELINEVRVHGQNFTIKLQAE